VSDETTPSGGETPGGEPLDVDEAFAAIIADWGRETPLTERHWPAAEDAGPELAEPEAVPVVEPAPAPATPPRRRAEDAAGEEAEDAERYVPPEPPPLPHGDLISVLAWVGALGGPVFLLVAVIGWKTAPQYLLMIAIVAFVAGFVTLVARMPQHRDDDGDDGAVV
jgi:hypothetical protein